MSSAERRPFPPFPPQDLDPPGLERDMSVAPRYRAPDYRAAGKLEGKVALVSGGDSGIGRAVALLYAREGARVAFTHLDEERPDAKTTEEAICQWGGESPLAVPTDVRHPDQCKRAVRKTVEHFGQLDILINNAAFQNHVDHFEDLTLEQWQHTIRTNMDGYFSMTRAALAHLPEGGIIINTGSITGLEGSGGLVDYSATKGAIHAFTKALAQNLRRREIRVNCVAPGPVWTPLNPAERSDEEVRKFGSGTPYGRPAQPEEIAPAYVFFASSDSEYISGEVLSLLGGKTRAA